MYARIYIVTKVMTGNEIPDFSAKNQLDLANDYTTI